MKYLYLIFIMASAMLIANSVLAKTQVNDTTQLTPITNTGQTGGTVQIENPLNPSGSGTGINSLQQFIGKIINGVLGIIGSLALVMFVYGGFTWMTSMGNPTNIKKGRDTMLWAAVGLAIIFSAYTLTTFVIRSVAQ